MKWNEIFIWILFVSTDINECETANHTCNIHSNCLNTIGSFICECNSGYTGSGQVCLG